jgi:hypothetical protein
VKPHVKESLGELRQLADDLDQRIADIQQDEALTREAKAERICELRAQGLAQYHQLLKSRETDIAALKKALNRVAQQPGDDPMAGLLASQQHEQTWRRIERRLESVEAKERANVVDQLIAEAAEREDLATLRALHAELPSYLQAAWPGLVPQVQRKLTEAQLPLARGIERTALEARAELDDQSGDATIGFVGKRVLGTATPQDRLAYGYAQSSGDAAAPSGAGDH